MTLKQRNAVLVSMTDEVAHQVLRDNYEQNVLIGNARAQQFEMVAVHARLLRYLEEHVDLDRALEALPTPSDLAKRHAAGRGLTSPGVRGPHRLTASSRLKADLLASGLPDDPWFQRTVVDYFPAQIRDRYAGDVANHPLRREIITNAVANSMVNRVASPTPSGPARRPAHGSTRSPARSSSAGRSSTSLDMSRPSRHSDNVVSTGGPDPALPGVPPADGPSGPVVPHRPPGPARRRCRGRAVRRPGRRARAPAAHHPQGTERPEQLEARAAQLRSVGVPKELAMRHASLLDQFSLLDIVELSLETGTPPVEVAQVYFHTSEQFGIDEMLTRVSALPREDRWDSWPGVPCATTCMPCLEALAQSVLEASKPGTKAAARYAARATANEDSVVGPRSPWGRSERRRPGDCAAVGRAARCVAWSGEVPRTGDPAPDQGCRCAVADRGAPRHLAAPGGPRVAAPARR